MRRVIRHVERLLDQRSPRSPVPRSFVPTDDDADVIRAAIRLRSARPEHAIPRGEFITTLQRRLAEQASRDGEPLAEPARAPRRRTLIAGLSTAAAAGAAAAVVIDRTVAPDQLADGPASPAPPAGTLEPNDGTWQTVMSSRDLPEGAVRPFDTGLVAGFAMRTAAGLSARSGTCTHQGCRLRFQAELDRLACPCHRTLFALDGTVVQWQMPTAPPRLPAIQIRETGDEIQVYGPPR